VDRGAVCCSRDPVFYGSIAAVAERGDKTMRWIMLLAGIGAFALALSTKSTGVMAFGLVVGFALIFASLFAFAAARIEATSRPDSTLLTDRDLNALRAAIRKPQAKVQTPAPPAAEE
jgi:hypothetical protein